MIDIAVSTSAANACSDAVSSSIQVSIDNRSRHDGPVTQLHPDWLGVGPLLPELTELDSDVQAQKAAKQHLKDGFAGISKNARGEAR